MSASKARQKVIDKHRDALAEQATKMQGGSLGLGDWSALKERLDEAIDELQTVADEMEEALENMGNLRTSDRGQDLDDKWNALLDWLGDLEEAQDTVDDTMDNLNRLLDALDAPDDV